MFFSVFQPHSQPGIYIPCYVISSVGSSERLESFLCTDAGVFTVDALQNGGLKKDTQNEYNLN